MMRVNISVSLSQQYTKREEVELPQRAQVEGRRQVEELTDHRDLSSVVELDLGSIGVLDDGGFLGVHDGLWEEREGRDSREPGRGRRNSLSFVPLLLSPFCA